MRYHSEEASEHCRFMAAQQQYRSSNDKEESSASLSHGESRSASAVHLRQRNRSPEEADTPPTPERAIPERSHFTALSFFPSPFARTVSVPNRIIQKVYQYGSIQTTESASRDFRQPFRGRLLLPHSRS